MASRRKRGNGDGSVYFSGRGRRRPWAAAITLGWDTSGRPIRLARFGFTKEEAEELLVGIKREVENGEIAVASHISPSDWQVPPEVWVSVRFNVFQRDGFACRYCGARPPNTVLHLDHVRPLAQGGSSDPDNLVTSCAECNRGKGERLMVGLPV